MWETRFPISFSQVLFSTCENVGDGETHLYFTCLSEIVKPVLKDVGTEQDDDDDWGFRARRLQWSLCAHNYEIVTPQKTRRLG